MGALLRFNIFTVPSASLVWRSILSNDILFLIMVSSSSSASHCSSCIISCLLSWNKIFSLSILKKSKKDLFKSVNFFSMSLTNISAGVVLIIVSNSLLLLATSAANSLRFFTSDTINLNKIVRSSKETNTRMRKYLKFLSVLASNKFISSSDVCLSSLFKTWHK